MCVGLSSDFQSVSESYNNLNDTKEFLIRKVSEKHIPKIIEKLETSQSVVFKYFINQRLQDIKESVSKETMELIELETRKCYLKSVSEAELLKGYNRRDNVRIILIPDKKRAGDNGQSNYEDYN